MNAKAISENKQASGCGRVAMCVFGLVFAGFGAFFLWMAVVSPAIQARTARSWNETKCRILSSVVESHSDGEGTSYEPKIKFEFELNGQRFEGDRHSFSNMSASSKWANGIVKRYRPGEIHPCFYDPRDPNQSVLNRDMDWSMGGYFLPVILPVIFILVGLAIAGFAIFGAARLPRRLPLGSVSANLAQTNLSSFLDSGSVDDLNSNAREADELDQAWSVPKKLKPENSKWVVFLITLGVAIFWNGIVSVFLIGIFYDDMGTWGRIGMGLVLTPFVLIGLVLLSAVIYMFMALFNPVVEVAISTGAVPIGGDVDIAWQIEGNSRRLRKLKLEIQGEQSATYQRGTTTHTDTEVFELIPVCEVTDPSEIEFGSSTIRIPESTMHTMEAEHNKVTWKIVVQGEIPWWPDVNAIYPFRVKPSHGPS